MQIIRYKSVRTALGVALSAGLGLTALTADLALTHRAAAAATWSPAKSPRPVVWNPAKNAALAQLMSDAATPSLIIGAALPASLAGSALLPGTSPLHAPAAGGKFDPERLRAALLTPAELPAGYKPMPDALKAFTDTGSKIGMCDTTPATAPGAPVRPVAPGAPVGPGTPAKPSPRSAVALAPGQPSQDSPPAAAAKPAAAAVAKPAAAAAATTAGADMPAAKPVGAGAPTATPQPGGQGQKVGSDTVRAAFMKGETGPVLIEAINPAGDRAARDIVAQVAAAPSRCPSYDEGKPGEPDALRMSTFPLGLPRFGNKSAGVRFEVEMTSPRVTVHGKMAAVSIRGAVITVLLVNIEQPGQHELEAITRKAVQKFKQLK
ncbi:hypothetical protein [Actinoplanes awajinensis]|uniref:Uncharacterized protein n=1 Tax=Actinoplanes awajinensis subsp. mycoplanecinus TaxID=135947 RepID=A0A124G8Q9_9ACTN|nr:hypothetical protein [Actinoplanes awajinensis]KUL26677.1 hypothetical protein ADL15_37310 [Actinoplanes awajinensis subsp. mycoplanecinus]